MKISVVIPVYNEEKYIKTCLDSMINQLQDNDEIIVVDNNSIDKSIVIAKEYRKIKVIQEKKQGIAYARNAGFSNAKGEILLKVDADAVLPKNFLKSLKKSFDEKNIISYTCNFIIRDVPILKTSIIFSYFYQLFFKIIYGHYILIGPAFAVRKNIWNKRKNQLCTDDDQAHEDIDLSIHIADLGKIHYDKNNLVYISGRRMKFNPFSFFIEYPYIFLKMLWSHRNKFSK